MLIHVWFGCALSIHTTRERWFYYLINVAAVVVLFWFGQYKIYTPKRRKNTKPAFSGSLLTQCFARNQTDGSDSNLRENFGLTAHNRQKVQFCVYAVCSDSDLIIAAVTHLHAIYWIADKNKILYIEWQKQNPAMGKPFSRPATGLSRDSGVQIDMDENSTQSG